MTDHRGKAERFEARLVFCFHLGLAGVSVFPDEQSAGELRHLEDGFIFRLASHNERALKTMWLEMTDISPVALIA